jgi:thioredoxin reductase (NADPH)
MNNTTDNPDIIVIGGGPAGLSAAQYAARAGLSVHLFEEMAPGGQTLTIDGLENYPGFDEPIGGFELAQKFAAQAVKFGAVIHYATVDSITRKDGLFTVSTTDGQFNVPAVILATGAKRRELGVPGETEYQGKGVSYCATCDGPFFKNRKILVVGGGDSACDESLFLSKLTSHVVIIHRKERFRAQKSIADLVQHDSHIETRFFHTVNSIQGDGNKVTAVSLHDLRENRDYTENFDGVFIFVGALPRTQLVPTVEVDESGYIKTDEHMQSSIPGIYAVGDVRDTPFRQIVTSASDGAIAAHSAAQYIDSLKGQSYV